VLYTIHVLSTAYNADDGHEWCPADGYCGSVVYAGGAPDDDTIAVSRSLHRWIRMGTKVRISGHIYTVRDLMGPSVRKDQIDIYHDDLEDALAYGVKYVNMEILDKE
jgi:3D (Asp-Asp-Asp) domain-containing protein